MIDAGLVERVERAIAGFGALEVTLSEIGRFPTVVWVRPEPESANRELNRRLAEAFRSIRVMAGCTRIHSRMWLSRSRRTLPAWTRSRVNCAPLSPVRCCDSRWPPSALPRRLDRQWVVNTRIEVKAG